MLEKLSISTCLMGPPSRAAAMGLDSIAPHHSKSVDSIPRPLIPFHVLWFMVKPTWQSQYRANE